MRLRPFCDASGLGPSKVYELIAAKEIESFTAGKARLIVVQSYFDYIKRQQQNAPPLLSPNPRAAARDPTVVATEQAELLRRRGRPREGASPPTSSHPIPTKITR
jgi:hypothetical protein